MSVKLRQLLKSISPQAKVAAPALSDTPTLPKPPVPTKTNGNGHNGNGHNGNGHNGNGEKKAPPSLSTLGIKGWKHSQDSREGVNAIHFTHLKHGVLSILHNRNTNEFEVKHEGRYAGLGGNKGSYPNRKDAVLHAIAYMRSMDGKTSPAFAPGSSTPPSKLRRSESVQDHEALKKAKAKFKKKLVNEVLEKPYKSKAQQRWAHTEAGKKALGGEAKVKEWDEKSKGKKLPEVAKDEFNPSQPSKSPIGNDLELFNLGFNPEIAIRAKRKLTGKTRGFDRLLNQVDAAEEAAYKMHFDTPMSKSAFDQRQARKVPVMEGGTKSDYWQHQLKYRQQMMDRWNAVEKPTLKAAAKTKAHEAEINKRERFHQIQLDTAKQANESINSPEAPAIKLGENNDKLDSDSAHFTTMLAATCPGAGSCLHFCFGHSSGFMIYPDRRKSISDNTAATARPDFADRMIDRVSALKLKNPKFKKLRIHAIGDFYHQDYVNDWDKVVKAHPDIDFYAYTKSGNLDFSGISKNPNFILNYSTDTAFPKGIKGRRAVIAPNKHTFDALMASGNYVAANDIDTAASEKHDKNILLRYHAAAKAGWSPRMINQDDRNIIDSALGHMPIEQRYAVELHKRKAEKGIKAKKKLTLKERKEKLQRQLAALEAKEKKKAA